MSGSSALYEGTESGYHLYGSSSGEQPWEQSDPSQVFNLLECVNSGRNSVSASETAPTRCQHSSTLRSSSHVSEQVSSFRLSGSYTEEESSGDHIAPSVKQSQVRSVADVPLLLLHAEKYSPDRVAGGNSPPSKLAAGSLRQTQLITDFLKTHTIQSLEWTDFCIPLQGLSLDASHPVTLLNNIQPGKAAVVVTEQVSQGAHVVMLISSFH